MAKMSNQERVVRFLQSKTGQNHLNDGPPGNKKIVDWIESSIKGRDGEVISRANAHSYFANAYAKYINRPMPAPKGTSKEVAESVAA